MGVAVATEGAVASFHFSAQVIGRAKGRSAIAAAAYRAGERLRDDQTGAEHDFSRRQGVVHKEIMLPDGAAPWLADRQTLWNHVHHIETRRDAQLAREINLALPHELTAEERLALLRDFVRAELTVRGMVADLAIHAPTDNDPRNHHAHVMLTLRKATPTGLYRVKTREWNSDALLNTWRESWATWQNRYLARGHHEARVDHRTLAAQQADARARGDRVGAASLDRLPEIHVGPRAQNAARRGAKPKSLPRTDLTARPQGGAWRSAKAGGNRQRDITYPQIDRGSRAAYNARRGALAAAAVSRHVETVRARTARLRLIEGRYLKALRATKEGLRDLPQPRAGLMRQGDPAQRANRLTLLLNRRAHLLRRLQLLRLLLGRTDTILSGLFQVQDRAFGRSRVLGDRLLPRVNASVRVNLRPGRSRDLPW